MVLRILRFITSCLLLSSCWYVAAAARPQQTMGTPGAGPTSMIELTGTSSIEIHIKGPDGNPFAGATKLTLVTQAGQVYRQETIKNGTTKLNEVLAKQYTVLVATPGFEQEVRQVDVRGASSANLTIQLRATSAEQAAFNTGLAALPTKAQKELGMVLAALHSNNTTEALSHLEAANRAAPNSAEVNYLFGRYSDQSKDMTAAKSYWAKTLELNSNHLLALISMGEEYLHEDKADEALPYLKRAVEAGPTSWRAYAFLADAELRQGSPDDAIRHAERALELGHGEAENVRPFLAGALGRRGDKDRAIAVLQSFLKDHPADAKVAKQLENMQSAPTSSGAAEAQGGTSEGVEDAVMVAAASGAAIPSGLPPGVEEKVLAAEEEEDASVDPRLTSLAPNAQQAIGKAFEKLGYNLTAEARSPLEAAYRIAPKSAEVNYLFGVYSMQTRERAKAKLYWTKTLEIYPKHYRALISLGQALVREDKPGEALPYLERAVQAEPLSWRAHAIYADAYLRQGSPDEAVKHAELALELDPTEAAVAQRYLAAALAKRGEKGKAISVLQAYLRENHSDAEAKRQLQKLQSSEPQDGRSAAEIASQPMVEPWALDGVTALPLPATWLPPNIDKRVPPVEPGASCALDEVVKQAGRRIEEFVGNVDRFTATEFVTHESINRWGVASSPEKRKFDYLVSVEEVSPGSLSVSEYRSNSNHSVVDFPDGVETRGLPALVLIFHPYNAGSFEMSCEGLSQVNGKPAWQVHFRQRSDKPNRIRAYRTGLVGPSYPIALKGRAWIAADTFRITRLETDLIAPVPEILLVADHTAIEYGPVQFKNRKVELWLPQTAEVYYDWRGRRTYRRHSFSKYLLFAVEDKQKISDPKAAEELPSNPPSGPGTAQP